MNPSSQEIAPPRAAPPAQKSDEDSLALRRDLYLVLSSLYLSAPTDMAVATLCSASTLDVLAREFGEHAVAQLRKQGPMVGEDTRQEFFDVLAVPTARYVAPFEAVFCDFREVDGQPVGGLLMGPSTRIVARTYERYGYHLDSPELPDHIGCELAFLGALCAREWAARQGGDSNAADCAAGARRVFAREHTCRFVAALDQRLQKATSHPLYLGISQLASALVCIEAGATG